jgi:naphthalene 1,2-dioxygenase ferredoxin component
MGEEWHRAGKAASIEPGDAIVAHVAGREIAIFRVGSEFFATDNRCTHAAAPLADGYLDGEIIECPLHQGLFNVRTGHVVCAPPLKPLRTYEVRVVDQQLEVRV